MKKHLLLCVMFFFSISAFASTSSLSLTPEQQAELQTILMSAMTPEKAPEAVKEVINTQPSTWGEQAADAAEGFAHAIAVAAQGVGVSVSSFVDTPAGKLVVIGIGLKLFGPMFMTFFLIVFGALFMFFATRYMIRAISGVDYIKEGPEKSFLWGLYTRKPNHTVYHGFRNLSDGTCFCIFLIMAASIISTTIIVAVGIAHL